MSFENPSAPQENAVIEKIPVSERDILKTGENIRLSSRLAQANYTREQGSKTAFNDAYTYNLSALFNGDMTIDELIQLQNASNRTDPLSALSHTDRISVPQQIPQTQNAPTEQISRKPKNAEEMGEKEKLRNYAELSDLAYSKFKTVE